MGSFLKLKRYPGRRRREEGEVFTRVQNKLKKKRTEPEQTAGQKRARGVNPGVDYS